MKKYILTLSLMSVIAMTAGAEVKPVGTVLPISCAKNGPRLSHDTIQIVAVTDICSISMVGFDFKGFEFSLNDGTSQIWQIEEVIPGNGGINPIYGRGVYVISQWGMRTVEGSVIPVFNRRAVLAELDYVTKQGRLTSLRGQLPGNLLVNAVDFHMVLHTMTR
jgi:hypothetical protein